MTYTIPRRLQYEEKIIFGLTFKQLIYLLIFGSLSLFFKNHYSLIFVCLGLLFMFTDLPIKFYDLVVWFVKKKKFNLNFEDLTVYTIDPVNFKLLNKFEQGKIIKQFQKYLNSVTQPVKIIVKTESLNLDNYYDTLGNDDEVKTFLDNITENVFNRKFYLITKEESCLDLLSELNPKKLSSEELHLFLRSFFYDVYQNVAPYKKDYVQETIFPTAVEFKSNHFIFNGKHCRVITVDEYPRNVEEGFLDKIITLEGMIDINLSINPYQMEQTLVFLNTELKKQRADLYISKDHNPSLELQYKDTLATLSNVQKGAEKMFSLSLNIFCQAESLLELDHLTARVKAELNSQMLNSSVKLFKQYDQFNQFLPFNSQFKGREITTSPLSAFFPFTSKFSEIDTEGVFLGLNKNKLPIIKNLFKLYNSNGIVLASSGAGKSYFTKLMILRLIMNETKVVVIDPQSEYVELFSKGQVVEISKNSSTIINPLDLMGHDYDEKKLTLLELFPIMIGEMSEIQKAMIDKTLTKVYSAKGIINDPKTYRKKPPIMEDLLKQLKHDSMRATRFEKETYRSLINRLEMYVTGVFSFLNRQTKINFNSDYVCFNIGEMPEQVKPVIMFLILDYVYMKMCNNREEKMMIVDEAWMLMQRSLEDSYIFKIVKTGRKFKQGILLITQDVDDLLVSKAGRSLLNNSEYTLLLRQKPHIVDKLSETFRLSNEEKDKLVTASVGEGILLMGNNHSEIQVVASASEHTLITKEKEIVKKNFESGYEEVKLDYSKGFFAREELNTKQVEDLLRLGYFRSLHVPLVGGKQCEYLLKPTSGEKAEHYFLVEMIYRELLKYDADVKMFRAVKPDVVFTFKKKKYAFEIETGVNKLRDLQKKVESNSGYTWWFVVSEEKLLEKYSKLWQSCGRRDVRKILRNIFGRRVD
jgi:conjugal transfer ATP-binding protein TraC